RPDIVFTRPRVAIFVDGCFWHGCQLHCRMPSDPSGYWYQKIERNRERDVKTSEALRAAGWTVIRVWEHEPVKDSADVIYAAVTE
ncbi:hypothetical protein ABZ749_15575, partial [Micromonospora sp. NPDC047753]|uniref:hypothetical protein n=1 Tax=Micromonospora sp. NPDC047753 TaxID=3154817 RepID=UPI0033BFC2FB